jgi:hypothetical protein
VPVFNSTAHRPWLHLKRLAVNRLPFALMPDQPQWTIFGSARDNPDYAAAAEFLSWSQLERNQWLYDHAFDGNTPSARASLSRAYGGWREGV